MVMAPQLAIPDMFSEAEKQRLIGNQEKAFHLYLKAAKDGNPIASHWIGTYYYEGITVKKDIQKAIPYFLSAAKNGVGGSMVYLANIYLLGTEVEKDCDEARFWITKASDGELNTSWKNDLDACK